jgi:uncharacterized protein
MYSFAMGLPPQRHALRDLVFRTGGVFVAVIGMLLSPRGPAPHVEPSYDCTKAILPTEKEICADPQLAKIDSDFAVYYQDNLEVVTITDNKLVEEALKRGERDFLDARNSCGAAKWCIERTYAKRNLQLLELVGEPPRGFQRTVVLPGDVATFVAPVLREAAIAITEGGADAYSSLHGALAPALDSRTSASTEALVVLLGFSVGGAAADDISCELIARGNASLPALNRYGNVLTIVPGVDMSLIRRLPSDYSVLNIEGRIELGKHCARVN